MPPRRPSMNHALVAFVDILGVKGELERAKTDRALHRIFEKILLVHQEFEKEADRDTKKFQQFFRKRLLALSDALVIAVDVKSTFVKEHGFLPAVGILLTELALAQAYCVLRGVFIRGGISLGQFFFSRDILVSKSMLRAYEIERDRACYPAFVIDEDLRQLLASHPQRGWYGKGEDPASLLYRFRLKGEERYCLHYLRVAFESCDTWYSAADREAYRAEKNERKKQRIADSSYFKSARRTLIWHKSVVSRAFRASCEPHVKRKYEWVAKYHNKFVARLDRRFASCAIDVSKRQPIRRRKVS